MLSLTKLQFKPQLIVIFSLFFGLLSVVQVAEAKRFGGGKSFGYNKQVAPKSFSSKPKAAPSKQAAPAGATPKNQPASGASKWLGPLAGFAAGGLLAAMLFGDGFEGIQLFDILLFALIAFVLFKLFARRVQSQQGAYQAESYETQRRESYEAPQQNYVTRETQQPTYEPTAQQGSIIGADLEDGVGQGVSSNAQFLQEIPAWFDADGFVDGAKGHFVTLQKAWDNVDLSEIESYCTPELFAALKQELQGVNAGDNRTVVDSLDAEIAAMAVDGEFFVVSVRFSGFIEEDAHGAHAFNEIWHIRRLASDEGNWLIAGIQQTNG